ncbi:unnamed protein product [Colias eurytheme]|nr:unnamed protein product [Colias eurytheme]
MSSGSESDDDYVPEEPEKVSEEESADEETEQQFENEVETKTKKRKSKQQSAPKKKIKKDEVTEETKEPEPEKQGTADPEEEKKREEDLWAKFLEGTDSKPKPKTQEIISQPVKGDTVNIANKKKIEPPKANTDKDREKRIFEFAGETIVVENNVIKERVKTAEKPTLVCKEGPSPRAKPAGLSSIVGQLNKKNTLSTLEKSKLDWNTYKADEGIEEEITSHNKGKAGYLERQDFLGRTDVRQYEIERDLRMSKRSNR